MPELMIVLAGPRDGELPIDQWRRTGCRWCVPCPVMRMPALSTDWLITVTRLLLEIVKELLICPPGPFVTDTVSNC